jgi:hypothetical protein
MTSQVKGQKAKGKGDVKGAGASLLPFDICPLTLGC